MAANMLLVILLPTLVTFLVTSGVWVGVYFIAGLNNPGIINNYYGSESTVAPPLTTASPPLEKCEAKGKYSECTEKCEFVICESIPADLYPDPFKTRGTTSTTECWLRLIENAKEEIVIGSYYWTLLMAETPDCTDDRCEGFADDGKQIFDALKKAAERKISIRIAMNEPGGGDTTDEPFAIRDVNPDKVRVRALNFPRFMNGSGILHTKSMSVDGKHSYVGSANFDWRSLTQVKEIGMAVFDCECLAEDVQRMIDIYWYMGAEDAVVPAQWGAEYTTNANHEHPYNIPRTDGPATAVHYSSAPPALDSCGRDSDIENMIKMIDEAEEYVYMSVMDYAPTYLYNKPNTYYERLDAAIRRAAYDRSLDVKFMMSKWAHTNQKFYSYMHEFDNFGYLLPYPAGKNSSFRGKMEVKLFELPQEGYDNVPYSRVQHCKYFVTEKAAYIGTSNWSADYWVSTGGIGISIRSADHQGKEKLVEQIKQLYLMDFNSVYATPIWNFTISGKRIE